jgi:TonB-linked SusC/RagA family outer membrane protein
MSTTLVHTRRLATVLLAAAAWLACAGPLSAQATGQIAGTVTAQGGAPVSGATVEVLGTQRRAVTSPQGRFTIAAVPAGTHQLRVTAIGHASVTQSVTVPAGGTADANIQLTTQAVGLNALVVVGYTAQRQRDVSGSVATVNADQLETRKVATVEQALRGQVPGVNIIASGEPGRPADVIIRGQNFTTDPSPLYVVDGMYMRQNPGLNPDDIASIQVLKDASAASQYGAQSANGVIVITTKRGQNGDTRVSASSYYGFQQVPRTLNLANAEQWASLTRQIYEGAGAAPPAGAVTLNGVNTDWQDAILRAGAIQNHNLQVSGVSLNANYMVSGGYLREQGTVIGTDFNRASLRVNSELRRGIFTLGENISLSRSVRNNLRGNPLLEAVRLPPVIAVRDSANPGGYGFGSAAVPTFGTNPVGQIETATSTDQLNQVLGTIYAQLRLGGSLTYRLNLGGNYQDLNWRNFVRSGALRLNNPVEPSQLTDRRDNSYTLLMEHLLTFNDVFGSHSLNAVAGYTEQIEQFNRLQAFRRNFPDETLTEIDAGTSELNNSGFKNQARLHSFLARANYTFRDRYLLTGTFRRDGSSRFGPNNRWGNFGALSAGWVVSQEGFYEGVPLLGRAVNYLKLRASYGVLGNQDIGDYQFAGTVGLNRSYLAGTNPVTGAIQLGLANPDIKWQEDHQTNFGADFGLMDDRLTLSADYYVRNTDDILVPASLPLSLVGYLNAPYEPLINLAPTVNAGSIRTSGFEFGARHRMNRGDFRLNTTASLTTTRSKVTELGNGQQSLTRYEEQIAITQVGSPVSSFWVLKTDGIFQSAAEVQAHRNAQGVVIQPNAQPGDVRYVDVDGNGTINDGDRYIAGSAVPDFEGGLFFEGGFRRFDFALGLRGVHGNEIFNRIKFWTERLNDLGNYRSDLRPWTPQNPSTTTPRAVFGPQGQSNARLASDRWIEDGSFLRVENIELGYALPDRLGRRLGVNLRDTRVYLNVQNVFTFTGYSGFDPEVRSMDDPLTRGIDDGRMYPNPRTVTLGVDVGF